MPLQWIKWGHRNLRAISNLEIKIQQVKTDLMSINAVESEGIHVIFKIPKWPPPQIQSEYNYFRNGEIQIWLNWREWVYSVRSNKIPTGLGNGVVKSRRRSVIQLHKERLQWDRDDLHYKFWPSERDVKWNNIEFVLRRHVLGHMQ